MSLPTFPEFNIHEDENVSQRWKRWVQKLDNMFVAMDITNQTRKKAMFLHYAGEEINEIVTTLEFCEAEDAENCFDNLCQKLDQHFQPKVNKRILVFKFRSAIQSIEDYVIRLRTLAKKCNFSDMEDEITNQLIFTMRNRSLQRKALEDNLSLNKIIESAKAMTLVERDLKALQSRAMVTQPASPVVQHIHQSRPVNRPTTQKGQPNQKVVNHARCQRCGSGEHASNSTECPARGKPCHKCSRPGHFARFCKTKPPNDQRQSAPMSSRTTRGKTVPDHWKKSSNFGKQRVHNVEVENDDSDEGQFVNLFAVGRSQTSTGTVCVQMNKDRNLKLSMCIDSGAAVNIINKFTFSGLRQAGLVMEPKLL